MKAHQDYDCIQEIIRAVRAGVDPAADRFLNKDALTALRQIEDVLTQDDNGIVLGDTTLVS